MRTVKQINFHASFLPWFSLPIFYRSSGRKSSYGSPGRAVALTNPARVEGDSREGGE